MDAPYPLYVVLFPSSTQTVRTWVNWDLLIIADCSPLVPHYSAADEAGFIVLRIMDLSK